MPKIVHRETMCCNYKRCPTVTIFDDGSVQLEDDDVEEKSLGVIHLKPEVAAHFAELITSHKKSTP